MTVRDHQLHLYDSLQRASRRFEPLVPGHVGIYVCGPTVYSDAHLGHAKSYVSFDVLVRYLRHLGYRVRYVQNITDVGHLVDNADDGEDKLERRARLDQVHPMELAEKYTRAYLRDMEDLKIVHADIYPRATQHVPEQIEIIETLIAKGHAYVTGENVYFDVASWPQYGVLSGRSFEDAQSGHRVGPRSDKRDPRDFALWKSAEGGHVLRWKSPWGWGYPGWHIECSAMSSKYLGDQFDIHGGGLENQFPHHECEIAQSRAAGMEFARFWIHNNMINVDGQKMSKSLNNYVSCRAALNAHAPEVIRYFILSTHYRSPANYTADALSAGASGLERLHNAMQGLRARVAVGSQAPTSADVTLAEATRSADVAFHAAMDEDLNTPGALAALFDLTRQTNVALADPGGLSSAAAARTLALFEDLGEGVLGVAVPKVGASGISAADVGPYVDLLVDVRGELKRERNFALADRIRGGLSDLGIEIKDGKETATWTQR